MSDFDDILGGDPPKRGRPSNEERERRIAQSMEAAENQAVLRRAAKGDVRIKPEEFLMPVGRNWLAKVLGMDSETVKKRLANVPPHATLGHNRDLYLFHDVIGYLVKPKMDIGTYLRTLNAADMPNSINKTFWEAERIKNRVLIETGEAWHDADVLEVLGLVFMMFKDRIPLITEGMREAGLTDAQSRKLEGFADQLQTDLHAALTELPKQRRTAPRRDGIDPGDGPTSFFEDTE